MDAAKQFVAQFTSKRGHKTYVDEEVRPSVTFETIKPTRHEIITEAVNREVHQHHYHTTVQPISHTETLPTKHTHNLIPVVKKDHTHVHRDRNDQVKNAHVKELSLFKNERTVLPTTHSVSAAPAVVGEHVHHHVHEIVQPVIFKETIMPERVHKSIPIHEVHHHEPIHHPMSEIAAVTMDAFMSRNKLAPSLMKEEYDGQPRAYNTKFHINPAKFHNLAPIDTKTANRNTMMSTPPLSPASVASSDSGPSTPRHRHSVEPGFRTSEDSMPGFTLNHSPSTKTTTKTTTSTTVMRNGQIITPQRVQI